MCSKNPVSERMATSTIIAPMSNNDSQSTHVITSDIDGLSFSAANTPIDMNVVKTAATVR